MGIPIWKSERKRTSSQANIPLNSTHTGGVNILLGDGSVRFLSETTDLATLGRLAVRDDGQVLTNFN